jgi:hypothetical protein
VNTEKEIREPTLGIKVFDPQRTPIDSIKPKTTPAKAAPIPAVLQSLINARFICDLSSQLGQQT